MLYPQRTSLATSERLDRPHARSQIHIKFRYRRLGQDQGSDDEESGGEGWGDADSDGTIAAAKGYGAGQPNPTPEPEGQLKQAASPTRVGKMPRNSDRVGSVPGAAERESMKGRGGKVTLEYGNDSVAGMGEGCVALAVPLGTQVRVRITSVMMILP